MTKMHLIAKLGLTVIGINVFLGFFEHLYFFNLSLVENEHIMMAFGRILHPVLNFFFSFFLIFHCLFNSDKWALKIVGSSNKDNHPISTIWVIAGFRLALFFCGLLIILNSIDFIAGAIAFTISKGPETILDMFVFKNNSASDVSIGDWLELVSNVCKSTLGIYLILGAPHFGCWQMKKYKRYSLMESIIDGIK